MVNVRTGRLLWACIRATIVDESMPPDRNAPNGTSAIISRRTTPRSNASKASTMSATLPCTRPVACKIECVRSGVPQRKSEHAGKPLHRPLQAPALDRRQHHLRIGVSAERAARALQLGAKVQEVVYLPVEHYRVASGARYHRLVPFWRQIENREPSVPQRDAGFAVVPVSLVVRTTMTQ